MSNNTSSSVILLSAIIIGASLVFAGIKIGGNSGVSNEMIQDQVQKGIEAYKEQEAQKERDRAQAANKNEAEKAKNLPEVGENDYVRGGDDPKVTIIEYSDFECPFCKRFHNTPKQALTEYGDDVRWVYRHYPLGFHDPHATKEALAVECAGDISGNEAFWDLTDLIYETTKSNKGLDLDTLPGLAEKVGVDKGEFETCMNEGRFNEKIKAQMQAGVKAGVTGTPGSFVINHKTGEIIPFKGAKPYSSLKAIIDGVLSK